MVVDPSYGRGGGSLFSPLYSRHYSNTVGLPSKAMAYQSNTTMTAFLGEAALLIPAFDCNSAVAPGDLDRFR